MLEWLKRKLGIRRESRIVFKDGTVLIVPKDGVVKIELEGGGGGGGGGVVGPVGTGGTLGKRR